ncbi:MAG TPA: sugar phosphate nucleotidyltransferase [Bacteroidota bacterium]|nr:sugar phosphate nucleotidyltransferase [Bacteroidota bacterium]
MDPNLVILAGGISSRMRNAVSFHTELSETLRYDAKNKSKAMIRVGNGDRPFLDYLLSNAHRAGYADVVIVVGEHDAEIRKVYGEPANGKQIYNLRISYAQQSIPASRTKPLGTADALLQALLVRPDWQGKQFTVCNSDNLYSVEALRLLRESPHPNALIDYEWNALRFENERLEKFSFICRDPNGFLIRIIEKPTREELANAPDDSGRIGVSMNIFRLSYDLILPALQTVPLHPLRNEKELPEAVSLMVRDHPNSVKTIQLAEYVPDLTSPDDIGRVADYLRANFQQTV